MGKTLRRVKDALAELGGSIHFAKPFAQQPHKYRSIALRHKTVCPMAFDKTLLSFTVIERPADAKTKIFALISG
jgi:hypothetical protein